MRTFRFAPWVLLGCLVIVANCGKDQGVPSSGAVGHVVVVEGDVKAQRANEETRPVRVDDTVYADDTIITGPAASVEILLTHNGALWELGESTERRIDKGIAFRATTKGSGLLSAKDVPSTAAAGRGTTREAADSVGTVVGFEGEAAKEASADDDDQREMAVAPAADVASQDAFGASANDSPSRRGSRQDAKSGKTKGGGAAGDGDFVPAPKPEPRRRAAPPPPPKTSLSKPSSTSSSSGPGSSAPNEAPSPEPVLVTSSDADSRAQDQAKTSNEAAAVDEEEGGAGNVFADKKAAAKPQVSAESLQVAHYDALVRKCHKTHGGKGTLRYSVLASGAIRATKSDPSLLPVVKCLLAAAKTSPAPNKTAVKSTLRLE